LPGPTPTTIPQRGSEAISADGQGPRDPPIGRTEAQDEKKKLYILCDADILIASILAIPARVAPFSIAVSIIRFPIAITYTLLG
jgi:hypothetical protein